MDSNRKSGTISRLFPEKVFGFIYCPADTRDYFFHQSGLENRLFHELLAGDIVTFVVGEDRTGRPCAEEIQVSHHDPAAGHETRAQVGLPERKDANPQRRDPRNKRRQRTEY